MAEWGRSWRNALRFSALRALAEDRGAVAAAGRAGGVAAAGGGAGRVVGRGWRNALRFSALRTLRDQGRAEQRSAFRHFRSPALARFPRFTPAAEPANPIVSLRDGLAKR